MSNITGYIGIIHKQVGLPAMWTALSALEKPVGTAQGAVEGTSVAQQRNALVMNALALGAEWVCFIDDDHVFAPDTLLRLLARNLPIVGGTYVTRTKPHKITAFHANGPDNWLSSTMTQADPDGLIYCDGIGMGFTLIRRAVFEAIEGDRWFDVGQVNPTQLGEDLSFCRKAKAAGFPVCIDTRVVVPHLSVMAVFVTPDNLIAIAPPSEAIRAVGVKAKEFSHVGV